MHDLDLYEYEDEYPYNQLDPMDWAEAEEEQFRDEADRFYDSIEPRTSLLKWEQEQLDKEMEQFNEDTLNCCYLYLTTPYYEDALRIQEGMCLKGVRNKSVEAHHRYMRGCRHDWQGIKGRWLQKRESRRRRGLKMKLEMQEALEIEDQLLADFWSSWIDSVIPSQDQLVWEQHLEEGADVAYIYAASIARYPGFHSAEQCELGNQFGCHGWDDFQLFMNHLDVAVAGSAA